MYYLYGAPHSAYTAKARSYLIKQAVQFEERAFGHQRFMHDIIPAVERMMIPVMETAEGEFVQDSSDIVDYFAERGLELQPSRPEGAVARAVSHLFELFGGEGLMRPGMYFRWFFDEANMTFIENQFGLFMAPDLPPEQRLEVTRGQTRAMRKAAASLGVTEETGPAIEKSYHEFLEAFNSHLLAHPYIVGGTPSLGDYGMQVMFYAHLARDPYPSIELKNRAQAVLRWTERMNQPGRCVPEYPGYPERFLADGDAPETLRKMMHLVARDYLPELEANIALHNAWLAEHQVGEGALVGGEKMRRAPGMIDFDLCGTTISCGARTYSIYILQRLQDWVDNLGAEEQSAVLQLFEETGCLPFLQLRCTRRVDRSDNKEVWGAAIESA